MEYRDNSGVNLELTKNGRLEVFMKRRVNLVDVQANPIIHDC